MLAQFCTKSPKIFSVFHLLFGYTHDMQKFLGQGSNPCHSGDNPLSTRDPSVFNLSEG